MNATIPDVQCGETLVIRVDGREERYTGRATIRDITQKIGARTLDAVNVDKIRQIVMVVDDAGREKDLPVNARATEMYRSICRPGTTWQIRGDVVLVNDADFA